MNKYINYIKIPEMENPWEVIQQSNMVREKIWSKRRTFLSDVWFRFRKKTTSLLGLILILIVLVFALLGPIISKYSYNDQSYDYVNIPPNLRTIPVGDQHFFITINLKLIEVSDRGKLIGVVEKKSSDEKNKQIVFDNNGKELIMDYSYKPHTLLDENGDPVLESHTKWNKTYLFGTDSLGRDMMARLMFGARISLLVAFIAALTNLVIGVAFGSISAFYGGMVDAIMMRIVDIIQILPLTLYVILIMVFLDSGLRSIIIALGTVYWVNMARIVRAEMLSLKERDFVLASKTIGTSTSKILTKHLIPNAMGPILVTMTMLIPQAIFMEAFLSFIGLGIPAPLASLGTMCSDALMTLKTTPYQLFEPSLIICVLMFGFNFVGDGLRDALDPKLKK